MSLPTRRWWDLSTRQFAAAEMANVVAVLPVGAVEQHGPHLPVRVDAAINEGILDRALALLPAGVDVLALPALPVGKSDEHVAFPGTLTLSHETLARVWLEIAASVRRAGCRRLVFFNSHGGQVGLIDILCRDLRVKLGMLAVACSWFRATPLAGVFGEAELRHGIHGGELETSVMLHLHPDLVELAHARDFVPLSVEIEGEGSILTPEGEVGFGWAAEDLHPAGACGNAAAADAARGKAAIDRAAEVLARLLVETAAFPLARLERRPAFPAARP